MGGNVLNMAEKKKSGKRFPSREKLKYVGIPKEYWLLFESMTHDGEKFEGRSIAYLVKVACRVALQAEGKLDAKGKPVAGKPEGG